MIAAVPRTGMKEALYIFNVKRESDTFEPPEPTAILLVYES